MLVRRSRALVKPNIAKASKLGRTLSEKVTPASKSDTESADAAPAVEPAECSDNSHAIEETSEIFNDTEENSSPIVSDVQPIPAESDPVIEEQNFDPLAPERRIAHAPVDHSRLLSPKSNDRFYSTDYYEPVLPRPRKKFSGDEQLDPKKMRMMDMIYWNPKKEKAMTRRHVETESVKSAVCEEKQSSIEKLNNSGSKSAAPQVIIGPDGRLVIDEKSLVIAETVTDDSVWETIDEDRVSRKVTSLSFRNRLWRKGTTWTEKETELFYEILRCTGPDFGLMHEFFPTRARNELKTKFNREERNNWEKLKEVMGKPALLDDDLYERAATLQKEIEEEALNKKFKKVKDVDAALKKKEEKEKERKERERMRKEKREQAKLERKEKAKLEREKTKLEREKAKLEKAMKETPFMEEPFMEELMEKPIKEKKKRKKPEEREWDENTADLVEEAATLIRELERESAERDDDEEDDAEPSCSEEPVVEVRRSERTKKLSIKAQELLELTKKEMRWKEMHRNENDREAPEENLDGYDEESDDDSDSDDSDSSDDVYGTSSYCYRKRQAPRVIKTSDLLPRRNMEHEQSSASTSETPSTSKAKIITMSESSAETTETGPVLDNVEQDDQPRTCKDSEAPALNSSDQEDQTCVSKGISDGDDEREEPVGHSTVELDTSSTPPINLHTPEQGGDIQLVKRPEVPKASPSKQKSDPAPVRKRAFEKARPNIKLKQSRTTSHIAEETTSVAASNSSEVEHEVPAANREEEMDTMANEPDNVVTDNPDPQSEALKPRKPQQEEDLFKRTRPANRNKLKRPLRSRR